MEYRSIRAFPVLPGPHILRDIINRQHSAQNRGFAPTFIRDIFLPIASSLIRLIACSATSISLVAILFGAALMARSMRPRLLPVIILNISPDTWLVVPFPDDAMLTLPG